ncbi:ribonuclease D domain protein [Xanthomonas citri pv. mangiferaeindicae LMG 941]|nr:ribonuclease D domain protein [Xanthomonas citri pv. mangiferaeindicae LMG 941]
MAGAQEPECMRATCRVRTLAAPACWLRRRFASRPQRNHCPRCHPVTALTHHLLLPVLCRTTGDRDVRLFCALCANPCRRRKSRAPLDHPPLRAD